MDPPKAKPSHPTEQAYPDSDFKPLTKAEVQKFLEQQAFHLGELGFASNFTEFKDVCALWERKLEGAASEQSTEPMMTETDGEGRAVHEAMTSVQSTLLQLKERNRLLEDPRNKAVISEAEAEIDQLLFDAGKTKGYVTSSQLRRKVVDVMEIPCPRVAANFTNMLVHVPGTEPSKNDILEINMPLRSAIEDVYHMLDEFVRAQVSYVTGFVSPDDGDPFSGRESSGWKYQLVTRSRRKVLGTASIKLDTDSDYCDLIRKITTGPKPPVAILTNDKFGDMVARRLGQKVVPEEERDSVGDDILDEDGTPFLERVDWKVLTKKVVDGTLTFGEMDGGENAHSTSRDNA